MAAGNLQGGFGGYVSVPTDWFAAGNGASRRPKYVLISSHGNYIPNRVSIACISGLVVVIESKSITID